ncbi:MAG: hypothetical protein KTR15_04295 [Phycisphaeraceae bacterium]|nr:hypothetical protein [Phycisphaeraceae bacterium]
MKQLLPTSVILIVVIALIASSYSTNAQIERFEAADSEGVTATRDSTTLYLQVDADVKGPVKIPRLAAPLSSMMWQGSITDDGIRLKPEPDHWVIHWKNRPAEDATLVLQFGDEPLLMEEIKPIKKSADGSFYLPAHKAIIEGKKIRYEPQPYKNTVGFWTGKDDVAAWDIELDKPGRFSVAVLQGCGKGQGGSDAKIVFIAGEGKESDRLDFQVIETGHFQHFCWVHLGEFELTIPGRVSIIVAPKHIKQAALMDIRAIHLIRLPDKKK